MSKVVDMYNFQSKNNLMFNSTFSYSMFDHLGSASDIFTDGPWFRAGIGG